jgi:hypothetical protein
MKAKVITIPKRLSSQGDLVLIPRREYERLLRIKQIREFNPTPALKRKLKKAQQNYREGKSLSYDEFARALGISD